MWWVIAIISVNGVAQRQFFATTFFLGGAAFLIDKTSKLTPASHHGPVTAAQGSQSNLSYCISKTEDACAFKIMATDYRT